MLELRESPCTPYHFQEMEDPTGAGNSHYFLKRKLVDQHILDKLHQNLIQSKEMDLTLNHIHYTTGQGLSSLYRKGDVLPLSPSPM